MSDIFSELIAARDNDSRFDFSAAASASLAKNVECFVAQYFIKHPDADPKNLVLNYQPSMERHAHYKLWITERKIP